MPHSRTAWVLVTVVLLVAAFGARSPAGIAAKQALQRVALHVVRQARPGAGRVEQFEVPAPSVPEREREALVYLPPSYDQDRARRYPVVYLLHGAPGSNLDWFRHGRVPQELYSLEDSGRLPEVIAIAADGHGRWPTSRSLWANTYDGRARIEDFLVHDVVAWADTALRTLPGAFHRSLLGISDGADAAIRLLVRHPDEFGGAAGLSGTYREHGPDRYLPLVGPPAERDSVLRSLSVLDDSDRQLLALARRHRRVYFDSGVLDLPGLDCMLLDRRLTELRVPHESHLYLGWHDWPFWCQRLPAALRAIVR